MSKYEVTVEQFKKFIVATGHKTDAEKDGYSSCYIGGSLKKKDGVTWKCGVSGSLRPQSEYNHPVIHVSWNDAVAYCNWLSKKTGETYRLPTETEWEYAAGGGNKSRGYKYAGSNNIDEVAEYEGNNFTKTKPVGGKKPNELGLYDMSGNVDEWCSDWYDSDYYSNSPSSNPKGPSSGSYHVYRGGSWASPADDCRVKCRSDWGSFDSECFIGFRVSREY